MKKLMLSLMTLVLTAFGVFAGEPLVYGPFGTDDDVVIDKVEPTIFPGVSLTFGEAAAAVDDCVAVYRKSSDQLCGLGKVIVYRGQPQLTLSMQVNGGTEVYVKGWQKASGVVTDLVASLDGGAFAETVAMPESGSVDSVLALKTVDVPPPPASPIREEDVVIDKVEPTIFAGVSLTFGETPMAAGDVVGIYRKSTGVLCGYGEAIVHQGEVLMTLSCQVKEGTEVSFRGWQKATGTLTNLVASLDGGAFAETVAMPESGSVDSVLVLKTGEADPPVPPEPTVYAIAYDLAGGVNAAGNPASYTTNDLPIMLAAPTREGYDFAGWTPGGEIAVGVTGDLTFTATWEKSGSDQPEIKPGDHPYYSKEGAWYTIRQKAVYDPGPGSILEWEVEEHVVSGSGMASSHPVTNEGWYDIYRDGVKIDSVQGTGYYRDLGAKAGDVHTYVIYGYFGTGVVSGERSVRCPMNYSLTVSPTNVTATAEGGEAEISVMALRDEWSNQWTSQRPDGSTLTQSGEYRLLSDLPAYWKAKTDSKWITLVNDAGNGESVLKVRAEANDSGEARTAVVTVAPGQVWELAKKVIVVQEAKSDEPVPVEPTVYAIAYELDGGVNAAENPTSFTTNDLPITLAAPAKEGFEFLGWTPNGGVIAVGTVSNVAFTATWKKIETEDPDPVVEPDPVDLKKVNAWSAAYGEDGVLTVVSAKGKTKKGVTTSALTVKLTVGKKVYAYKGGVLNEDGTVTLPKTPKGAPALADLVLDGEGVEAVVGGKTLAGCKAEKPKLEELDLPETAVVGVSYAGTVVLAESSYPVKFSAKKLPSGLKINAVTGEITGVPTKAGSFAATVTAVSTLDKTLKGEFPVMIEVAALPAWAQGTFNGGYGLATVTVGKNGKISGKYQFSDSGKAYTATLSAKAFAEYDAAATSLVATVDCKIGKNVVPLVLTLSADAAFGSILECSDEQGPVVFAAFRNFWKEQPLKAVGKAIANKTVMVLDDTVELKFAANGSVKASARSGKTKLSCSTVFVPFLNPEPAKDYMAGLVYVYFPAKGAFGGYADLTFVIWNGKNFEEYRPAAED